MLPGSKTGEHEEAICRIYTSRTCQARSLNQSQLRKPENRETHSFLHLHPLWVYIQPISVIGEEPLLAWLSPKLGHLSHDGFILLLRLFSQNLPKLVGQNILNFHLLKLIRKFFLLYILLPLG
jgi:predicted signal transduction protein with EAL and GGDEF domain